MLNYKQIWHEIKPTYDWMNSTLQYIWFTKSFVKHQKFSLSLKKKKIRFYVAVEVKPYENGGGRAMEEWETCNGWERESREKNIPIFGIGDRYEMS